MLTTYDLPAVQQFALEIHSRRASCNGEGMFCSNVDESLGCHFKVCDELIQAVTNWAREVFAGRIEFEPEVERVFKSELERALDDARSCAQFGRSVTTECFNLERLSSLESAVQRIDFLLKNWISPQKSVAPGPRVTPSAAADAEIRNELGRL